MMTDRMQYVVRDFYTDVWIAFDTEDEAKAECVRLNEGVNDPDDEVFVTPWPAETMQPKLPPCPFCGSVEGHTGKCPYYALTI